MALRSHFVYRKAITSVATMRILATITTSLLALSALAALPSSSAWATPVTLHLSRPPSTVNFGVTSPSPALTMNGSFKDFTGELLLDPSGFEQSSIKLSLNLSSAQLPPDQVLQAILIQTTLARFRDQSGTFASTSIEPLEVGTYLVTGNTTWASKTKETSVPVEVLKLSASRSEIRFLLDGTVRPQDVRPDVAKIAPGISGSRGWAKATLVFSPRGLR